MQTESAETVPSVSSAARACALIGVLVALGWPFAGRLFANGTARRLTTVHDDFRTIAVEWLVVALLAAIAFGLQRLRPRFFRLPGF